MIEMWNILSSLISEIVNMLTSQGDLRHLIISKFEVYARSLLFEIAFSASVFHRWEKFSGLPILIPKYFAPPKDQK
jgi:hypothetical protein